MHSRKTFLPEPTLGLVPPSLPFQGKRVRLTKAAKRRMANGFGIHSSAGHIQEFGGRHTYGRVVGRAFGVINAPEVDVRWYPSNLRYAYNPADLEKA